MNPNFLEFEQPIAELEAKIEELRLVGSGSDVNISEEIGKLQEKSITLTENIFGNLSPWQISQLARHPRRERDRPPRPELPQRDLSNRGRVPEHARRAGGVQ